MTEPYGALNPAARRPWRIPRSAPARPLPGARGGRWAGHRVGRAHPSSRRSEPRRRPDRPARLPRTRPAVTSGASSRWPRSIVRRPARVAAGAATGGCRHSVDDEREPAGERRPPPAHMVHVTVLRDRVEARTDRRGSDQRKCTESVAPSSSSPTNRRFRVDRSGGLQPQVPRARCTREDTDTASRGQGYR